jgi:gamma-glutamyl hydrolase
LPLVGILSSPLEKNTTQSTVDASYVRWLEASGAEVVVFHPWYNDSQIDEYLSKINGILIPPADVGEYSDHPYYVLLSKLLSKVIDMADKTGVKIPIFGICGGFQALQFAIAKKPVLSLMRSYNTSLPLKFDLNRIKTSRLFSLFKEDDLVSLGNLNVTSHFHSFGVNPLKYQDIKELRDFFRITSTADDENGKTYVASIEAYNYPIYGVQFRPDYISFVKNPSYMIPQTYESIRVARTIGNFFVQENKNGNNNFLMPEDYSKFNYIDTNNNYPILIDKKYVYQFEKSQ